jgi:7-carboxy-7-deazaguanine synthase
MDIKEQYPDSKVDPELYPNPTYHKVSDRMNKKIPLMETFGPTIQGEGLQIGVQTYFMRFGLCDYKCTMCDSMHAVDPKIVKRDAKWLTQEEIFQDFLSTGVYKGDTCEWMTFTGGNPCIHDLTELVALLKGARLKINVETQGTYFKPWLAECDCITVSPKGPGMGEITDIRVLDNFLRECWLRTINPTMKVVVFDQRDLDFAVDLYQQFGEQYKFKGWFLSLGNPNPPGLPNQWEADHGSAMKDAIKRYQMLFEDIQQHPILAKMRFLPQWHWFVWGDEKGR